MEAIGRIPQTIAGAIGFSTATQSNSGIDKSEGSPFDKYEDTFEYGAQKGYLPGDVMGSDGKLDETKLMRWYKDMSANGNLDEFYKKFEEAKKLSDQGNDRKSDTLGTSGADSMMGQYLGMTKPDSFDDLRAFFNKYTDAMELVDQGKTHVNDSTGSSGDASMMGQYYRMTGLA